MLRRKEPLRFRLQADYEALIDRVHGMVAVTDPERLGRRPAEGRWSAAECIDHLNAGIRLYLEPFEEAIAEARREGLAGNRPDGRTLLGCVIAWALEPPPRPRTTTFDLLEPAQDLDPAELARDFEMLHRALVTQLGAAADLDRKRIKVRSVLDRRLKLSLDDWYAFHAAHGRRHLWQAERALEAL
jgi:hypothetical protein